MVIFSCCIGVSSNTDKDKKYLYIEATGTNSHGDYSAKIDTLEIMKEKMGDRLDEYEEVHDFRLLNEKLEEVDRTIVPDSVLAEIAQSIFSLKLEK